MSAFNGGRPSYGVAEKPQGQFPAKRAWGWGLFHASLMHVIYAQGKGFRINRLGFEHNS